MNRLFLTAALTLTFGCSSKVGQSLCSQIPAPAACMEACDSQPGAPNTCPAGYHCSPDGKCDAECTANGGECGAGYICTTDGQCMSGGSGSDPSVDANCPAVHFTPMATTPSITLVLDRSGSMTTAFGNTTRYGALEAGLFGATGAVTATQADVYFGEELFAGDQTPCTDPTNNTPGSLFVTGYSATRALNNATTLSTLTTNKPPNNGATPTAAAIDTAVADFAANPPPAGSPPILLIATDGDPNNCSNGNDNGHSVTETTKAYTAGIRTFIIGLAGLNTTFLQQMANAGTGWTTGMPNAPYYTANDPASLATAFSTIINGVLSCDLTITGTVDPATANTGTVTLNGMTLTYGTDWTIDPNGMVIHLIGTACTTLKTSVNPTVDASFNCGTVIF